MTAEIFKRTDVAAEHRLIPLSRVRMDTDAFAFRPKAEYKQDGKSIEQLAEELRLAGMLVEVLVQEDEGEFLVWDGHRRITAAKKLVQEGMWAEDHLIPAQVVVGEPSDLERLLRLGSVNISRRPWEDGGMIRYAGALARAKCPEGEIARVMGKSVKQVQRYLLIAGDPWAQQHVEDNNIDSSKMSTLLQLANKHNRRGVFTAKFDAWVAAAKAEILAENQKRDRNDQELLSGDNLHPKKHLKSEVFNSWKVGTKTGSWDGPSFRFRAGIDEDAATKKRKIEIDRLSADLDQLTLSETAKIWRRCRELSDALEPEMVHKKRLEELQPPPSAGIATGSAATLRLAALGLADLVDDDESFADGDDDDEFDVVEADEGRDLVATIELQSVTSTAATTATAAVRSVTDAAEEASSPVATDAADNPGGGADA